MSRFAKEAGNCSGGQGCRIRKKLGGGGGGDKSMRRGKNLSPPSHLSRLQQGYFRGGLDPTSVPNIIFLQAPEFSGK